MFNGGAAWKSRQRGSHKISRVIRIVQPFESQNRAQAVNQLSQKGVTLLPGVILEVPIVCELHE